MRLPAGLRESDRLPEPIFTPATKSMSGEHDENISFDQMVERVGAEHAEQLRDLSLAIYAKASEHAHDRGLILADTKFEFGLTAKGIVLADEALTPDSSRFWPSLTNISRVRHSPRSTSSLYATTWSHPLEQTTTGARTSRRSGA